VRQVVSRTDWKDTARPIGYRGENNPVDASQARRHGDPVNLWLAAGAAAVLAAAHLLATAPSGWGSNQFPRVALPCVFRELTGVPCPGCGLTRSVCETARGRLRQAFAHHYLGPAIYLAAWVVLLWSLAAASLGLAGPGRYLSHPVAWKSFIAVLLAAWVIRLIAKLG